MRLIKSTGPGHYTSVWYIEKDAPRYAVLSHTWGADSEEVTYRDLIDGTGKSKAGWHKIDFCRKQAAADDLQHFWVDTCCINKDSSTELDQAIVSMFRWYRGAEKCYVYLSDISTRKSATEVKTSSEAVESLLGQSRWFRRGWTLQELIAPTCVEFFSREGDRLGTKRSLEQLIHGITGIAIGALRGRSMTAFAVRERLGWAETRATREPEDRAYCMLGIFNVSMPLIYGEGEEKAFKRLRKEIGISWKRE